jgi:hypothetical protein
MASKDAKLASVLTRDRFPGSFGTPFPAASIAKVLSEGRLTSVLVAGDYPNTTIP